MLSLKWSFCWRVLSTDILSIVWVELNWTISLKIRIRIRTIERWVIVVERGVDWERNSVGILGNMSASERVSVLVNVKLENEERMTAHAIVF